LKNIPIAIISIIGLFVFISCDTKNHNEFRLPIYTPADLDPDWVDSSLKNSTEAHVVNDFEFINQNGLVVNEQTIEGKIYIAEFFFTTCPGICPILTKHTKKIQDEFLNDHDILILSHTVYPEHDSVSVLYAFGKQHNINSEKWHLLTGSKQDLYTISRKGYFAISYQPDLSDDGFIHTENVVLVDKQRRLRGIYNGTNVHEMNRLIEDIYLLKKEYQI
jgi:protein SCO1/2|tara:strand:- start:750 stop:1406 length:657 start_codon:yes stop_codon:yes gene_type:complete